MLKEEFYVALRLVALMQNNQPANANSIMTNLEVPLPRFDTFMPSLPRGNSESQKPSAPMGMNGPAPGGINVDELPGLDDLDFSKPAGPMLMAPETRAQS